MKNRFWVYIVASKSGTLYIGMTSNLDRRIAEHKQRAVPGFTAKAAREEDRADRIPQPALGGPGRTLGCGDVVTRYAKV